MNKAWVLAFSLGAIAALLGCTSTPAPTTVQPVVPPAKQDNKVVAATAQQPAKPAHDCVTTESSQMYVQESVRLALGEGDTYLRYCFVSGYQGIDCADKWEITNAVGHGLSNRERAECDDIMRRLRLYEAELEARKKQLDEAYDKQHGLQPDASQTPSQAIPAQSTASQTTLHAAVPQIRIPQAAVPRSNPSNSSAPANSVLQPASSDSDRQSPQEETPAEPSVTEAERYIYGRGVSQDCDHGLRLLKQAAEESNARAMISMGALYSTGTCTLRDLPTAYRWFALALHKEPDNQALQDDLRKLWGQMTQSERQLAIKLSQ
jgi:hypothetical protein